LLYPSVTEAIREVHKLMAMFSLYSNFYYASQPGVLEELTSPTTKMDYVRISLNAGTKESYNLSHLPWDPNSFEIILENIKELLRLKRSKGIELYVHLTYLLDRHNSGKRELEGIVKWAAENKGIAGIRFNSYQKPLGKGVPASIDFSEERFRETASYIRELGRDYGNEDFIVDPPWEKAEQKQKIKTFKECRVGKIFPVIGMDGGVYPCTSMASPFSPEQFCYGNINTEDFWEIWERVKTSGSFSLEKCYDCTRAEFDINKKLQELVERDKNHL